MSEELFQRRQAAWVSGDDLSAFNLPSALERRNAGRSDAREAESRRSSACLAAPTMYETTSTAATEISGCDLFGINRLTDTPPI